jgi:hypothetical protein
METAEHWARLAMFQILEVQEAPAFNGRRSFLTLRGSRPFADYKRKPGDLIGLNWRVPGRGNRAIRHAVYDTNWWKSFVHARLSMAFGDRGSMTLFGNQPKQHRMFVEQLTAEYRVKTEGRGRVVDEWKVRPGQPDNHWLDCLVGCAVAASICGCNLEGMPAVRVAEKRIQRTRNGVSYL